MYFFDLYHEQQYDEALDVNISCFAVVFDILVKTNAVPFVTWTHNFILFALTVLVPIANEEEKLI